jgi:hypothetical protein
MGEVATPHRLVVGGIGTSQRVRPEGSWEMSPMSVKKE